MKGRIIYQKGNKEIEKVEFENISKIVASKIDEQEGIEVYSEKEFIDFFPLDKILSILIY